MNKGQINKTLDNKYNFEVYKIAFIMLLFSLNSYGISNDSISMLSGHRQKYWERDDSIMGLVFRKDNSINYFSLRGGRFLERIGQHDMFTTIYRINNGNLNISYDINQDSLIESFRIKKISKDSLILENKDMVTFIYLKAKNQHSKPSWDPRTQYGYEYPKLKTSIDNIAKSIYKIISKIPEKEFPDSFSVNAKFLISKRGTVKHVEYINYLPQFEEYPKLYSMLLNKLINLDFISARNKEREKTYEETTGLSITWLNKATSKIGDDRCYKMLIKQWIPIPR